MSFTGTQQKCKACEKTVYAVELLSADGVGYHKSCFKCTHCKSRLQVSFSLQSIFVFMLTLLCLVGGMRLWIYWASCLNDELTLYP